MTSTDWGARRLPETPAEVAAFRAELLAWMSYCRRNTTAAQPFLLLCSPGLVGRLRGLVGDLIRVEARR